MKIKLLLVLLIGGISFYGGYKTAQQDVIKADTKTTERVVIEEENKKTTIYRTIRDKSKIPSPDKPRKYRLSVLVDPSERRNYELVLGYRFMDNLSLEGSWEPNNGQAMIGFGIAF